MEDHPDPQLLERFMRNEVDSEERRSIVRHLLAACPRCLQVTRRLWSLSEARLADPRELGSEELHPASPRDVSKRRAGTKQQAMEAREEAEILELRSRLLANLGRLEEAGSVLDRALALARDLGDSPLQGRLLVQKGAIRGWSEGGEAAREGIRHLRQGLALLDEHRDSPLAAFALHRLAVLLADARSEKEALRALRLARPLYEQSGDGPNLVRLRHLEGKIEESLGSVPEAEAAFVEARRGFLVEGLGVEAAEVLLDLAVLYRREGRAAEVRGLAEDLLPILRAHGIRQGVGAALLFFRDLVETGNATLEVLFAVSRYVRGPRRVAWP